MSDTPPTAPTAPTTPPAAGIDMASLWGDFQTSANNTATWRDELAKKAAYKALNIPPVDDMNITSTVNHNYPPTALPAPAGSPTGRSWLLPILATLGLAVGAGGLGVGTGLIPWKTPAIVQPTTTPTIDKTPTVTPQSQKTVTWVSYDGGLTWEKVPLTKVP